MNFSIFAPRAHRYYPPSEGLLGREFERQCGTCRIPRSVRPARLMAVRHRLPEPSRTRRRRHVHSPSTRGSVRESHDEVLLPLRRLPDDHRDRRRHAQGPGDRLVTVALPDLRDDRPVGRRREDQTPATVTVEQTATGGPSVPTIVRLDRGSGPGKRSTPTLSTVGIRMGQWSRVRDVSVEVEHP